MNDLVSGNDLLAETLRDHSVEEFFFLMGGPMLGAEAAILELGIRGIDARHEQAAAMMAHAYARVLNKPAVCMAASGPGVTNLVTGVGNAWADQAPLIAIGGTAPLGRRGWGDFQECDQVAMFPPITKWCTQITETRRIPEKIDEAFRRSVAGRPGPVYLDCPGDVLYASVERSRVRRLPGSNGERSRPTAGSDSIKAAVEMLRSAERPLLIYGSGVLWSGAEAALNQFVDAVGIPFYATPQGRGAVPEDHPLCFLAARSQAQREADVVVVVGTRLSYVWGFGMPPRFGESNRVIQIDIDPEELDRGRRAELAVQGDAKAVLEQLIEACRGVIAPSRYSAWVDMLRASDAEKRAGFEKQMSTDQAPIHPLRLCKEVRDFIDRDGILVVDGQEILNYGRAAIPCFGPRQRLNSGVWGTMGVGLPFGLGAKVARPDKQVLVLHGDGSFGLNAMEIDTAVRHKINVVTVISNNGGWTADPKGDKPGRNLGHGRYDKMAEAFGAHGEYVERPEDIRPALERAFKAGIPAVVNVKTDHTARAPGSAFAVYAT
jgi:acetolactate synthase-1/2/3 large subunit